RGVLGTLAVNSQRELPQSFGSVTPLLSDDVIESDELVVAGGRLGGRSENRFRQPTTLNQTVRQPNPGDRTLPLVLTQPLTGEIAARDALHADHRQRFTTDRAPRETSGYIAGRDDMIRHDVTQPFEPPR